MRNVLHCEEVSPCELFIDNRVFEVFFPLENRTQNIQFFFVRDITSQKDMETRLQQERDIFAAYMETIPIAIARVNKEGMITFANRRAEEVLSLSKSHIADLTYNTPQWHITDFDGNPFPEEQLPFVQVMNTCKPVCDVCHAIRWPDGKQRFLSINAAPLFSSPEECDGMVAAFEDITERIMAEQALQESEERYRAMFTHMRSGVAVYEVVGNGDDFIFRDFNPSAERISNIEREKVIGKRLLELFPYMDRSGLFAALQQVYRSGQALHLPAFYYKDKVREGWRENFIYKLPNGNLVAIYSDVTERELAIRALRENEALYKMAAELTSDYIFKVAVAPEGSLQLTNTSENFTSLTGRSLAETTTVDTLEKIIHPDDWPQFERVMHKVLTKGDATSFECRSFTAEGVQRWIRISVRPQYDEQQERMTTILGSVKDISERKRSEETLRNTQRLEVLGVLAGGIAHDFNNLLGGMFGYLDMVKESLEGNELQTALQYIEKALTVYNSTRGSLLSRDHYQAAKRHKGNGRVPVMDDEEYIRDVTTRMLMKMGYQTECAAHGDEAIEKFEAACTAGTPFDMVLLDLAIAGGKGGLETIYILRQKDVPFRAIAASGYSDDPVIVDPHVYGFDAGIKKTFRKIHLEEMLEKLAASSE